MAKRRIKKGKTGDKLMNVGLAAGGGLAAGFVSQMSDKIPFVGDKPYIGEALPLVASFFLVDMNPALAYGMAGGAGRGLGQEFGIGGITTDDINGIFDDVAEVLSDNATEEVLGDEAD